MQPSAPELKREFGKHDREVERALRKDRSKLFRALGEFAIMGGDAESWQHFRRRWPEFFPAEEYESAISGVSPSIADYPYWLDQIWRGGETDPYLEIMLGVRPTPEPDENWPENAPATHLRSIAPLEFALDWNTGRIRYRSACDFQRALYLLYRESWRARVCERCEALYIASRESQRYCSTDCSEEMQREVKRKWWAEHGREWREQRSRIQSKKRGKGNGTKKAR